MHEAISKGTDDLALARAELDEAVNGMRQAAQAEFLPRGLLSRAWLRSLEGNTDGARADLDEAQQIAECGPMRLHLADVHLHRARLFCDKEELKRRFPR